MAETVPAAAAAAAVAAVEQESKHPELELQSTVKPEPGADIDTGLPCEADLMYLPGEQGSRIRRPSTSITPLDQIVEKRLTQDQLGRIKNAKVREFYGKQNELIDAYQDVIAMIDPRITSATTKSPEDDQEQGFWVTYLISLSFGINLTLALAKILAAILSGSLTVIASALDSVLDLLSALILSLTRRSMLKYNPYKYPQGRNRLEPAGIMVFAVIMGMGSLLLIIQSAQVLAAGLENEKDRPSLNVDGLTIGVLAAVICLKLFLWVVTSTAVSRSGSQSLIALADDHRNDVVTNCVGLATAIIANDFESVWWLDPTGAIFFALLIIVAWVGTGREQLHFIVGGSASNVLLSKLTYLAAVSDERIRRVDTIIAYHFGVNFLVQCDIVLPKDMPLKEAHDIGDALERRMERLDEVERAFVHLDWEWQHAPEHTARLPNL